MQESNGNRTWQEHIERHDLLISRILDHQDAFRSDLDHLLRAQVLLTESQQKLTESQQKLTESQQKLTEAQRRTDEKMTETTEKLNALIDIVDGIVRKPPPAS